MSNAARVLEALGDPTRRKIFEIVGLRPMSVAEVAAQLPVSRPAVSQHLRVLKDVRLVTDRAEGTRRVYSLDRQGLEDLYQYLDQFWGDALERFKRAAERAAREHER